MTCRNLSQQKKLCSCSTEDSFLCMFCCTWKTALRWCLVFWKGNRELGSKCSVHNQWNSKPFLYTAKWMACLIRRWMLDIDWNRHSKSDYVFKLNSFLWMLRKRIICGIFMLLFNQLTVSFFVLYNTICCKDIHQRIGYDLRRYFPHS